MHAREDDLTNVSTKTNADGSITVIGTLLGAQFLLNFPSAWNHQLVLFAHGYVAPGTPGGLDLVPPVVGTFGLADILSAEGYAYGYSMFSKEGYAVQAGIFDTNLLRLIGRLIFHAKRIYVGGASMGGDITMGLVERFPHAFAGALPACGAVAGWYDQIGFEADFRAVYDYFTEPYGPPLALPGAGNLLTPNPQFTTTAVGTSVLTLFTLAQSNPVFASIIGQIATITGANPDPKSFVSTLIPPPVLEDYLATSGGNGYSNIGKVYRGSLNDAALNAGVERVAAVPAATKYLNANYTTTGAFTAKVLTIHNLIDPVVRYQVEAILKARAAAHHNSANLSQQVVDSQPVNPSDPFAGGPTHCYFSPAQIAFAWGELRDWVTRGVKPTDGLNITNN